MEARDDTLQMLYLDVPQNIPLQDLPGLNIMESAIYDLDLPLETVFGTPQALSLGFMHGQLSLRRSCAVCDSISKSTLEIFPRL